MKEELKLKMKRAYEDYLKVSIYRIRDRYLTIIR